MRRSSPQCVPARGVSLLGTSDRRAEGGWRLTRRSKGDGVVMHFPLLTRYKEVARSSGRQMAGSAPSSMPEVPAAAQQSTEN